LDIPTQEKKNKNKVSDLIEIKTDTLENTAYIAEIDSLVEKMLKQKTLSRPIASVKKKVAPKKKVLPAKST
jgi:3-dehydroquinate dehydratase